MCYNHTMTFSAPTSSTPPLDTTTASDTTLLQRIKQADESAAELLVQRYAGPLVGYLHRLSGSAGRAAKLHRQTWENTMLHLDQFNPQSAGGFKAWIYRIATNQAIDYRQHKSHSTPNTPRHASIRSDKLTDALDTLPHLQKQILLLRHYGNLTPSQLRIVLGYTRKTLLQKWSDAIDRIDKALSTDIPAPDNTTSPTDQDSSQLLLYLAGELDEQTRTTLEARLSSDHTLNTRLQQLDRASRRIDQALQQIDAEQSPAFIASASRSAIKLIQQYTQASHPQQTRAAVTPQRLRFPWWYYPTASATAIVLAFLVWWGNSPISTVSPYPSGLTDQTQRLMTDHQSAMQRAMTYSFSNLQNDDWRSLDNLETQAAILYSLSTSTPELLHETLSNP